MYIKLCISLVAHAWAVLNHENEANDCRRIIVSVFLFLVNCNYAYINMESMHSH